MTPATLTTTNYPYSDGAALERFRVEFVTYKWPEWLRRQSEKQRIIWGYKILFLDVLFPLHVDKVIYVDADQVGTMSCLDMFFLRRS